MFWATHADSALARPEAIVDSLAHERPVNESVTYESFTANSLTNRASEEMRQLSNIATQTLPPPVWLRATQM